MASLFTLHSSAAPAWKLLSEIKFDIIMIDFQLKQESGLAFYKALRLYGSRTPLLMLGEGLLDEFILKDLSLNHYDYLMKPFFFQDLKMKINGLLNIEGDEANLLRFGHIRIDVKKQLVHVKDEFIRLGKTELKILMLLAKKAGEVVDLKKISEILEKEEQSSNITALFYVKKLRSKIKSLSHDAFEILSIQNQGFKLEYII